MAREHQARLCIVSETATGEDAVGRVLAVLDAADVAALIISPAGAKPLDAAVAKPLVDAAQEKGVAALIVSDAQLARTLRADGVHLPWDKDAATLYDEARQILGDRSIVGASAGRSRHDAMTLCEAGADYVGFGVSSDVKDQEAARADRAALIEWWNEIFQVPCVAFDVESQREAAALADLGADFVTLTLPAGLTAEELAHWAQDLENALTARENAA